jgi:hypothetical protein
MSDAMAAPQAEVELRVIPSVSEMSLTGVVGAIIQVEQLFYDLYKRYHELTNTEEVEDNRLSFKPSRNLKVAANRSYQWARRANCTAAEARERALAATWTSARTKYPASIVDGSLPEDVLAFIEKEYTQYNLSDDERRLLKKKANGKRKRKQIAKTRSV